MKTKIDLELLRELSADRALASRVLFKHRHPQESPEFHNEIMDLWRCADENVLIEAFRQGAKSTLSEEFIAMEAAFGNFHHLLLFCETYEKACERLAAIDYECRNNDDFLRPFGGKILAKKSNEDKMWFESGPFIRACGWEQEIRSYKYLTHRPDRAYLDDIENKERTRDPETVTVNMRKLYQELMPAMDKESPKIRFTQTPIASDCMVVRLREYRDWISRRFPICNGDIDSPHTKAAWSERYPMEWVKQKRDSYREVGMLPYFNTEYMLEAASSAVRPFEEKNLRFLDLSPASWLPRTAIYDPARSANATSSDRTGKVVVSKLGSRIIVHESNGEFWKPDQIIEDIFKTDARHNPDVVAVEQNSLNEWLMQPLRTKMLQMGRALHLKGLQAPQDRDKVGFIMGLQPFIEAGDLIMIGGRSAHTQLIAEILNFPSGKLDILNALAYSLRMFAGVPVYQDFCEQNIADAPEPRRGEKLHVVFNASSTETVCVALHRDGVHWAIARDFSFPGPVADAVSFCAKEVRATYPGCVLECYVTAESFEQAERFALVPSLRRLRFAPRPAEYINIARGTLADPIRMTVRGRRTLTVDRRATLSLNALAGAYKYPIDKGGRIAPTPEDGIPRIVAEGIESLVAFMLKGIQSDDLQGTNLATNPQGATYVSAIGNRRR